MYRTRFLVKARQLHSPLSFIDPLGREQCGKKGDYLVESADGRLSIAPQAIFEDVYVAIGHETWDSMVLPGVPQVPVGQGASSARYAPGAASRKAAVENPPISHASRSLIA